MRLLPLLFMIDVVQPSRKMLKTNRRCLFGTTSLLAICLAATISLASGVAIYSPPRNLTVAIPNGNQCTDNATWIGSGSTSLDCIGAVQLLYNREVSYWKDQDFEFISEKVKGRSIPWQRTPRKYTVGTCTVAIVMLSFFADGELPGIDGGPFASRDVTSFYEIWQTASQIESSCLLHSGKPGWASQGGRGAVGVFLWGTDSAENRRVPQGEPVYDSPSIASTRPEASIHTLLNVTLPVSGS